MTKAVATETSVFEAADASYTTVKRFLTTWQEHRAVIPIVAIPPELTTLGDEWLRRLWARAAEHVAHEGQAVWEQARIDTEQARRELAEAMSEVQRLEQVEAELTQALEVAQNSVHALELRNAALEAQVQRVETLECEAETLLREAVAAGELRELLTSLQVQITALSASRTDA